MIVLLLYSLKCGDTRDPHKHWTKRAAVGHNTLNLSGEERGSRAANRIGASVP